MKHTRMSLLLAGASPIQALDLEKKDADLMEGIKKTIEALGKDVSEFKNANDARLKELEKKGSADILTEEKVNKINSNLDKLIEQKDALEKALEAEKKEREALELRIEKGEFNGKGENTLEVELKSFNITLASHAADRKFKHVDMTMDEYKAYKLAFDSFLRKDGRLLTAEEIKTLSVGSDPDGGYLVTPDRSGEMVKKIFETSEMRQIADIITISTDALEGLEDLGEAGVGYAGEHALSGDTTTAQFGKWSIPTWILDTEPKVTQKLLDDANIDVEAWILGKGADKFARFENAEFVTGSTKIRGIAGYTFAADTGSGVTWGSVGYVATGVDGDWAASNKADKIFDLMGLLKNAYLPNARFVTRRSVIQDIRKFKESTTNAYMWQPGLQQGVPERLLGYPIMRMEDVAAIASQSYSMFFGDFKQAYQIVDRAGIRILRDPYTAKPYVKFYQHKRTGGGIKNFEALKALKFYTS